MLKMESLIRLLDLELYLHREYSLVVFFQLPEQTKYRTTKVGGAVGGRQRCEVERSGSTFSELRRRRRRRML